MARRSAKIRKTRMTGTQNRISKAAGFKVPRRASVSFPSVDRLARKANRKIKGAHPLHDPTGSIHAMTGAKLTDGHLRPHSAFTHMQPYRIPKGIHPKKRMG